MRYRHLRGTTALSGLNDGLTDRKPIVSNRTEVRHSEGGLTLELGQTERGVIVSNPLRIEGRSVYIETSELDPLELRRSLLFWDRIVWPVTDGIHIAGGVDVEYLVEQRKLIRPLFHVNGDAATAIALAFRQTYQILEDKYPGQWLMSEGKRSLQIEAEDIVKDRGIVARFINAVPVPQRETSLEDILQFREGRKDEVDALRDQIDSFYQEWVNSEDQDHQFRMAISRIDRASADMVRVARESQLPFSMSSWKVNFSANPDMVKALTGYVGALEGLELGTVGSLLTGAASSLISVGADVGLRNSRSSSPFNYVASMEQRLN